MKYLAILGLCLFSVAMQAQELFWMTEPASNAPAGSIGVRVGQSLMKNQFKDGNMYNLSPEVDLGNQQELNGTRICLYV